MGRAEGKWGANLVWTCYLTSPASVSSIIYGEQQPLCLFPCLYPCFCLSVCLTFPPSHIHSLSCCFPLLSLLFLHSELAGPLFILKQSLHVAHTGLRLTEIGLPLLPVLGLKVHATNPSPYLSQALVAPGISLHHEDTTRLAVGILVGSIFLTLLNAHFIEASALTLESRARSEGMRNHPRFLILGSVGYCTASGNRVNVMDNKQGPESILS